MNSNAPASHTPEDSVIKPTGEPALYHEVQRLRAWWLWGLAFLGPIVVVSVLARQTLAGSPTDGIAVPDSALAVLATALVLIIPGLLLLVQQVTEVRGDGVYVRMKPFQFSFQHIPWKAIKKYEVRQYNALREYGGLGARRGLFAGKAYTVGGNRGVQLELAGGARLLIGSQQPEELAAAIKQARVKT